ncbi:MAG TPA: MFS transporter [Chloroflexota bacterium]|nr:MFS transporter [Chloroflexota bacterium]
MAVVGIGACFLVNSLTYLAMLAALIGMRSNELAPAAAARKTTVHRQVREGLDYVRHAPDLLLPLLLMAAIATFGYNFTVALPLLARYALGVEAIEFGALTSAMGVGSLIGALLAATLQQATWRTILLGASGFSFLLMAVALSSHFWLTIGLLTVLGLFSITFTTGINTTLQLSSEPEFRGRVMSLYVMIFGGSMPIGGLITGALSERVGIQATLGIEAIACALAIAVAAWLRHRWLLRAASGRSTVGAPHAAG